jgi:hypothetical protein
VLFGKAFDETPSEALGFASCSIVIRPGASWPAVCSIAASKFKTVPSVTPSSLVEPMKAGRPETENQPSLPKSSYRGPCH